jgi:hypothetical protein
VFIAEAQSKLKHAQQFHVALDGCIAVGIHGRLARTRGGRRQRPRHHPREFGVLYTGQTAKPAHTTKPGALNK